MSQSTTVLLELLDHLDKLKALHRANESPSFGQVEQLFDYSDQVRRSLGVPAETRTAAWPTASARQVERAARHLVELARGENVVTQGGQANKSGRGAEDVIASILRTAGCRFERQVPLGHTIYGHELRVDFLVTNISTYPNGLVIESKWQDQQGSADEKFPYLVGNIKALDIPVVVILHGNGYRPGATRWLRAQVDGKHLVAIYSLEEFLSWAMRSMQVVLSDRLL